MSSLKSTVVYFYFDFSESSKQSAMKCLRSLLFQLVLKVADGRHLLKSLYAKYQDGQAQPPDSALVQTFDTLIDYTDHTYIILDALDESLEHDEVNDLISTLQERHRDQLHIFATSRKLRDLEEALASSVTQEIHMEASVVDHDILLLIDEHLKSHRKLRKWHSKPIGREIREELAQKAHGMFRWVACQLDVLGKCLTPMEVRKKLATLPKTLDETYERILLQIEVDGYLDMALRLLQWLCFAKEKLTFYQLVDALATDCEGSECFSLEARLGDPFDLLRIGSSLVSWAEDCHLPQSCKTTKFQGIVSVAHFSVQEYLLSGRCRYACYFEPYRAHNLIAESCLIYTISVLPLSRTSKNSAEVSRDGLLSYAPRMWYKHALEVPSEFQTERLLKMALDLFTTQDAAFREWYSLSGILYEDRHDLKAYGTMGVKLSSPLYYSIRTGLTRVSEILVQKKEYVNCDGEKEGTPLQLAAIIGNGQMVRMLLDHGADINLDNLDKGTPLELAILNGHIETVRLLVMAGARLKLLKTDYGPSWPFQTAIDSRDEGILEVIGTSAEVKELSTEDLSNLVRAGLTKGFPLVPVSGDLMPIARWLLSIGADPDDPHWYSYNFEPGWYSDDLLICLLQAGAWPNNSNTKGETMLHLALSENKERLLNALLQQEVDARFVDNYGQTCVDYAGKCPEILSSLRLPQTPTYLLPPQFARIRRLHTLRKLLKWASSGSLRRALPYYPYIAYCCKYDGQLDEARVAWQLRFSPQYRRRRRNTVYCDACGSLAGPTNCVYTCLTCQDCWLCTHCMQVYKHEGLCILSRRLCREHTFMDITPRNGQSFDDSYFPEDEATRWLKNMLETTSKDLDELLPAYYDFLKELRRQGVDEMKYPYHRYIFFADDKTLTSGAEVASGSPQAGKLGEAAQAG
ncbi:hypothetical protein LTR84_003496 [Exophiala bonariae]|uniref:Nephrocystin 3-like N-terminal domain-containing protein n=1 Tax=Exophiala bonariae TaxID=1690606 RepID=A0AAV9NBR6_9EURO|nr:hypothetical protein LTR84_003496 [Exophiala bonariae]